MRLIGATLSGAAKATILWFILNAWTDGAGTRIVCQLGWPVSSYWLAAAAGAVGGIWARSWDRRAKLRHSAGDAGTAADFGLAYLPTVERPPVALPCFEKWHGGKDGYTGELGGVTVSVFDMTEHIRYDEGNNFPTRTIVLIPAASLPAFTATPRWAGRFAHIFGAGGMTFDPANAPVGEADTVRQFGRAVRIELPANPGWRTPVTLESRAAEMAVRRLITPTVMATLLGQPRWSFQTGAGWLACWRGQEVCPAGERPHWIAAAGATRAALLAAAADPLPVVLPPIQLPTAGQFEARGLGTFLGVLLGLSFGSLVAFFGTVAAFGDNPGVMMILLCLAAAVGGVVVGVLGFGIGAALGRVPAIARWNPLPQATTEQKAEKARRDSWRRRCGCLGIFVGGTAGLVASLALDHLIWPNNPTSVWRLAQLPILPIGGVIAGLMGGVALGGWVARRRG
jgi:hypothetical protein